MKPLHPRLLTAMAPFFCLIAISACRSDHVEVTIENQTGAPVHLLEVDYPTASFGKDDLEAGASYRYRVQVQGSGPVSVTWTAPNHSQPKIDGPELADREEGNLQVTLLPGGKAEFHQQVRSVH